MTVRIGRVTTSHKARGHAIDPSGAAPCHNGSHGRIISTTAVDLTEGNAGRVCRTRACRRLIAAQLVAEANAIAAADHRYDRAAMDALGRLADLFPPDRVPAPALTESAYVQDLLAADAVRAAEAITAAAGAAADRAARQARILAAIAVADAINAGQPVPVG